MIGPFHAALQHLAGQELEHRRFYIEVDASTIASRIKARIDEGHRPGPPVPPEQIAAHLASYHERLAEQGVFVAGRGDALVEAIRSQLNG